MHSGQSNRQKNRVVGLTPPSMVSLPGDIGLTHELRWECDACGHTTEQAPCTNCGAGSHVVVAVFADGGRVPVIDLDWCPDEEFIEDGDEENL